MGAGDRGFESHRPDIKIIDGALASYIIFTGGDEHGPKTGVGLLLVGRQVSLPSLRLVRLWRRIPPPRHISLSKSQTLIVEYRRVSYNGLLYQPSKLRMAVRFRSPAQNSECFCIMGFELMTGEPQAGDGAFAPSIPLTRSKFRMLLHYGF